MFSGFLRGAWGNLGALRLAQETITFNGFKVPVNKVPVKPKAVDGEAAKKDVTKLQLF